MAGLFFDRAGKIIPVCIVSTFVTRYYLKRYHALAILIENGASNLRTSNAGGFLVIGFRGNKLTTFERWDYVLNRLVKRAACYRVIVLCA